jgi:hypothetical protein
MDRATKSSHKRHIKHKRHKIAFDESLGVKRISTQETPFVLFVIFVPFVAREGL